MSTSYVRSDASVRARMPIVFGAAALLASASCSPSGGGAGDATRDCGYSVTWQSRVYLDLIYVRHPPHTHVRKPSAGRRLGHGFVPQCPGDSQGSPA